MNAHSSGHRTRRDGGYVYLCHCETHIPVLFPVHASATQLNAGDRAIRHFRQAEDSLHEIHVILWCDMMWHLLNSLEIFFVISYIWRTSWYYWYLVLRSTQQLPGGPCISVVSPQGATRSTSPLSSLYLRVVSVADVFNVFFPEGLIDWFNWQQISKINSKADVAGATGRQGHFLYQQYQSTISTNNINIYQHQQYDNMLYFTTLKFAVPKVFEVNMVWQS